MRKLASLQKIAELSPIPGADAIECARVLGWKVVVKKGEFKVGDSCVYVEIDSVLPERPEFEFLRDKKFKVRTVRLRGQVSQGICFSTSILDNLAQDNLLIDGADLTEYLKITKFEPPIPAQLGGEVKGPRPSFIPLTDETRVQVLQQVLDRYKGQSFYATEKLDGASATFYLKEEDFGVCSRNLELKETEGNTLWRLAKEIDIRGMLIYLAGKLEVPALALQGEIIGEGVQGNKYKLKGQLVKFFNLYDIASGKYLDFSSWNWLIASAYVVPIVNKQFPLPASVEELVEAAKGPSVLFSGTPREGLVLRPSKECIDTDNNGYLPHNRVSFKAINPDFLLKYGE